MIKLFENFNNIDIEYISDILLDILEDGINYRIWYNNLHYCSNTKLTQSQNTKSTNGLCVICLFKGDDYYGSEFNINIDIINKVKTLIKIFEEPKIGIFIYPESNLNGLKSYNSIKNLENYLDKSVFNLQINFI